MDEAEESCRARETGGGGAYFARSSARIAEKTMLGRAIAVSRAGGYSMRSPEGVGCEAQSHLAAHWRAVRGWGRRRPCVRGAEKNERQPSPWRQRKSRDAFPFEAGPAARCVRSPARRPLAARRGGRDDVGPINGEAGAMLTLALRLSWVMCLSALRGGRSAPRKSLTDMHELCRLRTGGPFPGFSLCAKGCSPAVCLANACFRASSAGPIVPATVW